MKRQRDKRGGGKVKLCRCYIDHQTHQTKCLNSSNS